jgi:hypothetical protein
MFIVAVFVVIGTGVGVLVGTGNAGLPSVHLSTTANVSSPKFSAMLLNINQLPMGWSAGPFPENGQAGCWGNIMEPRGVRETASASASFVANAGPRAVVEVLATYKDPKTSYRRIVVHLADCRHFRGTLVGHQVAGTVAQMTMPRYGDASRAFLVSFTVPTVAHEILLIVLKGNIVMEIAEGSTGVVYLGQFQGFVMTAVGNLRPTKTK